jgi:hypothetical protein
MYRKSITSFLSSFRFNKDAHEFYIDVVNGKIEVDELVFIIMICQAALQVGFKGVFEELYFDITKRPSVYKNQIIENLRTAFLVKESIIRKIFCQKITNREILFNSRISLLLLDFDKFMSIIFIEGNKENEETFKDICHEIHRYSKYKVRKYKILPIN